MRGFVCFWLIILVLQIFNLHYIIILDQNYFNMLEEKVEVLTLQILAKHSGKDRDKRLKMYKPGKRKITCREKAKRIDNIQNEREIDSNSWDL